MWSIIFWINIHLTYKKVIFVCVHKILLCHDYLDARGQIEGLKTKWTKLTCTCEQLEIHTLKTTCLKNHRNTDKVRVKNFPSALKICHYAWSEKITPRYRHIGARHIPCVQNIIYLYLYVHISYCLIYTHIFLLFTIYFQIC